MPKAFESPLLSHARTLAMLHATIELRALAGRLDRAYAVPRGLEACWVGPAIGLADEDLCATPAGDALVAYIRQRGQGVAAPKAARALLSTPPSPLPVTPLERLHLHIGAALALKQQNAGAMLAYTTHGEFSSDDWKRLLKLADAAQPPMVLIALPSRSRGSSALDLTRLAARSRKFLPVIPVDAGDPIALYRVTQESLGRARGDGGLVVVDCVQAGTDPVALLGRQALAKGLLTAARLERLAPAFQARLEQL